MRKMICLFLTILLLTTGSALAELSIDLAALTIDELVELHRLLDAELDKRIACEPSVFPAGLYIGGESIKPGSYIISGNDTYYGITVAVFSSVEIYKQAFAEQNEALATFQSYLSDGDTAFVHIDEGTVLLVSDTALIEAATTFWMP